MTDPRGLVSVSVGRGTCRPQGTELLRSHWLLFTRTASSAPDPLCPLPSHRASSQHPRVELQEGRGQGQNFGSVCACVGVGGTAAVHPGTLLIRFPGC